MARNVLFLLTISMITFIMNAQNSANKSLNDSITFRKNEFNLNILNLVLDGFEGTYERLINENSGIGLSLFIAYGKPNNRRFAKNINYYISPYYRYYFGKKPAAGFFVESFVALNSEDGLIITVIENGMIVSFEQKSDIIHFALGISVGSKWVLTNGLFGELNIGIGKNFYSARGEVMYVGKTNVSIGYRF